MARADAGRFILATAALSFSLLRCTSFAGLTQPDDASITSRDGAAPASDGPIASGEGGDGASSGDPCQAAAAYGSAVGADDPRAYFRFDEDGGTNAKSDVGPQVSCVYGSNAPRAAGIHACSTAIDLAGGTGSYVGCDATFAGAQPKAPFSLEAWILPRVGDAELRRVVGNQTSPTRSGFDLSLSDGAVGIRIVIELYNTGQLQCRAKAPVVMDRWNYILATYDGTTVTMRSNDGAFETDTCTGLGLGTLAAPLVIGANTERAGGFFLGKIDELAIYPFALSKARADAHFAAGPRL